MTTDRNRHLFPPFEKAPDTAAPATPVAPARAPRGRGRRMPGDGPDAPPPAPTAEKAVEGLKRRQRGRLITRPAGYVKPELRPFPEGRHPGDLLKLALAQETERRERLGRPFPSAKRKATRTPQNPSKE